jgi:hypothetical protein
MNDITFSKNNEKTSISINTVKYIYGANYARKYQLLSICRQYFEKDKSELQSENDIVYSISLDDREISSRNWNYYEISPFLSIQTDLKLTSGSLTLKYIDRLLRDIELTDELNTINILLSSLVDQLHSSFEENEFPLDLKLTPITAKQFIKLIEAVLSNGEFHMNQNDLTYDESVLYWLRLLQQIVKRDEENKYLVVLDLPSYSYHIHEFLKTLSFRNLFLFVFVHGSQEVENIEDYFLMDETNLDLGNEEKIYVDVLNNYAGYITLEEFLGNCKLWIEGKTPLKLGEIVKLVKT